MQVSATWTLPNLTVPPYVDGDVACVNSVWIGIDGFAAPNSDILQAGIDLDITRQAGKVTVSLQPWWEWWQGQSFYFENFPVSPGDVVSCSISCPAGGTNGIVTMTNAATRNHISLSVPAPAGTKLIGNCAEWIVERQTADASSSALTELSEFGSIFFDEAFAATATPPNAQQTIPAGNGTPITMTSTDYTTMLAAPRILAPNTIRIDRL